MPFKKTKIVIDLEHDTLKDTKKALFGKGMSVQAFFSYIAELISVNDSRIEELIEEAVENRLIKERDSDSKSNADTLYQLIEQELLRNKNGA